MKFKVLVEYEYPIEHKSPVKAEIVLHGDRVVTDNIKWIEQEPFINKPCISKGACQHHTEDVLDKIKAEIERQEKWLLQAGCNTYNVDIAFDAIKSEVGRSGEE